MRDGVHNGDNELLFSLSPVLLSCFSKSQQTNMRHMLFTFLKTMLDMPKDEFNRIYANFTVSYTGRPHHDVATDCFLELLNGLYKRIGGPKMSAETAARVSGLAHIYFQINLNFRDMTGIDTKRTRWNSPAREDTMLVVGAFDHEAPGARPFDIDPNRQDISCIPPEWTAGGKVQPRYFEDWFTLEAGVGAHTTARTEKWLDEVLQPGHAFDYTELAVEERDDEEVAVQHKCGKCKKLGARLVCAWCKAELYCDQRCRNADREAHVETGKDGFPAMCPGPNGSKHNRSRSGTEVGAVEEVFQRLLTEFRRGEVDLESLNDLLMKLEDDDLIADQCAEIIAKLWEIHDEVEAGDDDFDPSSLVRNAFSALSDSSEDDDC